MINKDIVERRIERFWGYGNLEAPAWLVGMEEGLSDTDEQEIDERFRVADGKTTIDIRRDMVRVPLHMAWFKPPSPPIQPNWKYPIALYLYLKARRRPLTEEIRAYQLSSLGDVARKETCVIELMPLPARSTETTAWIYEDYVGTRQRYMDKYKPDRVRQLRSMIVRQRPSLVIFHSLTYLPDWSVVIGSVPRQVMRQMYFAAANGTSFCIVPNANSRGMSYARLYEYADRIRAEVNMVG